MGKVKVNMADDEYTPELFQDYKFWECFRVYCKENKIADPVWNPKFLQGIYDESATFVDRNTGWAYEVKKTEKGYDFVLDRYHMDFNMYTMACWKCEKELENLKHCNRCFFCKDCCRIGKHPDPYV